MTVWSWVPAHVLLAWQARLIERFGGAAGVRDEDRPKRRSSGSEELSEQKLGRGLLDSALARPANLAAYEPDAPVERLAAVYGAGLAKAHAFIDGNKRIAFAVMVSFLRAHGRSLDATEADATAVMLAVAAGELDQSGLESWIVQHCRPSGHDTR